jgi:hypothetical protein
MFPMRFSYRFLFVSKTGRNRHQNVANGQVRLGRVARESLGKLFFTPKMRFSVQIPLTTDFTYC